MSTFKSLGLKTEYRTGDDNVVEQFLRPCLSKAKHYYRSVGYFSSSSFKALGVALSDFVVNGGDIRLITSVELTEEDYDAIEKGYSRVQLCEDKIINIINEQFTGEILSGTKALLALVESGRLHMKIALPKHGKGIYHEKLGIFIGEDGDYVVFCGSMNESNNGYNENYECIDIFTSWDDESRAQKKVNCFDRLWNNADPAAEVLDFPDAAREKLIKISKRESKKEVKILPPSWEHQSIAKNEFLKHERGILNMATGTGKTRTALSIARSLFEKNEIQSLIICTDGNDLLKQWSIHLSEMLRGANIQAVVYKHFETNKEVNKFFLSKRNRVLICSRSNLAKVLSELNDNDQQSSLTLMICDEVHGMGSPSLRSSIQPSDCKIRFRLGLSATPDREYDEEGNEFIEQLIGPVIFNFGLEEAIKAGILTPFQYAPIPYELTENDRERLQLVHRRKAARLAEGNPMSDEEVWTELSKVYKTAEQKIPLFCDFLDERPEVLERCMIFVETIEFGIRVAEQVQRYRRDYHTYFGGEDAEILKSFATGELELLISCHRLSEGIDIKSTSAVVLFSSARARLETIQRIGRCLRIDPDNPNKIATVVDFVRDDENNEEGTDTLRFNWLNELSKVRRAYHD